MKKHILISLLCITSQLPLHADITDGFRRRGQKENTAIQPKQSGFLHETYQTNDGNTKRRFAPVESLLGINRRDNTKTDATDYKKTTRSGKEAVEKTYQDADITEE